jgi:predicted aspartyl protease
MTMRLPEKTVGLLGMLIICLAVASPKIRAQSQLPEFEVPLQQSPWDANLLTGSWKISGKSVRYLIDTGAGVSALSASCAEKLQVIPGPLESRTTTLKGELLDAGSAILPVQLWPNGPAKPVEFVVLASGVSPAARKDAILGLPDLESTFSGIDFGGVRLLGDAHPFLRLLRSGNSGPAGRWQSVRVERARSKPQLFVTCMFKDHPISWMIDTGANRTLLDSRAAAECALQTIAIARQIRNAAGVQDGKVRGAVLDHTEWENETNLDIPVLVTRLEGLKDRYVLPSGGIVTGILGVDFLNRHAAVIDWKHGCLHLRSK